MYVKVGCLYDVVHEGKTIDKINKKILDWGIVGKDKNGVYYATPKGTGITTGIIGTISGGPLGGIIGGAAGYKMAKVMKDHKVGAYKHIKESAKPKRKPMSRAQKLEREYLNLYADQPFDGESKGSNFIGRNYKHLNQVSGSKDFFVDKDGVTKKAHAMSGAMSGAIIGGPAGAAIGGLGGALYGHMIRKRSRELRNRK